MSKPDQARFNYFHSRILDLRGKQEKSTGIIGFQDGVKYLQEEQEILRRNKPDNQEKRFIHELKRVFNGNITED